jgi:phosphohistidine phosphatase
MKRITLIRHAKSSWESPELDDFDRPLNNRGFSDAPEMGKRLKTHNIIPDIIIVSPALRAMSTAKLILEQLGISVDKIIKEQSIYDASPGDLLEIIGDLPDTHDHVFLIGHNPALHIIAQFLVGKTIIKFPTCAVFSLECTTDSWSNIKPEKAKILFSDSPKQNIRLV